MNSLILILLLPFLVSCQALTATTSVISSSVACSSSEKDQTFPAEGATRRINLTFNVHDGDQRINHSSSNICSYKGSICGGGSWFQIWHGDQSIFYEYPLLEGGELRYWPHGFCMALDNYYKSCKKGDCSQEEHFKLRLMFSERIKKMKGTNTEGLKIGNNQDRALVTFEELPKYGYPVESYNIEIINESL